MGKFSRLYVKYIIKTPVVFNLFLLTGVLLFLYFSLNLKLDVIQNTDADIENNRVTVEGKYTAQSDMLYLYNDRNEKVYKYRIEQIDYEKNQTVFVVNNSDGLSGKIQAEIVIGSQTLLERIFIRAGKG